MSSLLAWKFANKLSQTVLSDKSKYYGEIMREVGYSKSASSKPTRVIKTKSFQKVIKPTMDKIETEMNRILEELANKDVSKERYDTLITAYEKFFKVKQLQTGGNTENVNVKFEISEKIANKNANDTNS